MRDDEPLTLEGLLERFPWDREPCELEDIRPLEWLWHYDLKVDAKAMWQALTDTSRFNRALGLSRMEFEERDGQLYGTGTNGGVRHEWVEIPWEWVSQQWLVSRRLYSRGFPRYVRVIYVMERRGSDSVRVSVYFGWLVRGALRKVLIKLGMPSIEKGYRRLLHELADELRDTEVTIPKVYKSLASLAPGMSQRLQAIRKQLIDDRLPERAVDRLVDLVVSGDDMDVYRIQLRRLAHEWNMDVQELLLTALHATRAGMLHMSWDVICPHCRGVREEAKSLGDVPERGGCDVCEINFETDGANALEITFHVHPSIRDVPKIYFCSAEPSKKDHIAAQLSLEPGKTREIDSALIAGRYRLRVKGQKSYHYLDVDETEETNLVVWDLVEGVDRSRVGLRPSFRISCGAEATQLVIEDIEWRDDALRPVHLFNFQQFRDLFSHEYLGTDVQLAVGEQTIMFTDIVGSTRFYIARGDPGAFMDVKRHFTEVFAEVARYRGAVVKTIGDAALASFSSPVDALKAGKAIHDRFPVGREDSPIRLRISLNTGPCIAVKLNANIDYFGTTVNVAAKLQACCESGEIAMTEATHGAPGVAQYLASESAAVEELSYEMKALGKTLPVFRWNTNSSESRQVAKPKASAVKSKGS